MAKDVPMTYDILERSNGTKYMQHRPMTKDEYRDYKRKEKKKKEVKLTEIVNNLNPHGARCIICGKFRVDDVRKCKKEWGMISHSIPLNVVCIRCCNSIIDRAVVEACSSRMQYHKPRDLKGMFPSSLSTYSGESIFYNAVYFRMRMFPALKRRLKKRSSYVYHYVFGFK